MGVWNQNINYATKKNKVIVCDCEIHVRYKTNWFFSAWTASILKVTLWLRSDSTQRRQSWWSGIGLTYFGQQSGLGPWSYLTSDIVLGWPGSFTKLQPCLQVHGPLEGLGPGWEVRGTFKPGTLGTTTCCGEQKTCSILFIAPLQCHIAVICLSVCLSVYPSIHLVICLFTMLATESRQALYHWPRISLHKLRILSINVSDILSYFVLLLLLARMARFLQNAIRITHISQSNFEAIKNCQKSGQELTNSFLTIT